MIPEHIRCALGEAHVLQRWRGVVWVGAHGAGQRHPHWQCIVITIIEQAGLNLIKKELNLLQRLYKLYNDVINSVNGYITNLNEDSSSSS